jgi:hypothetical protein
VGEGGGAGDDVENGVGRKGRGDGEMFQPPNLLATRRLYMVCSANTIKFSA